MSQPDLPEWRIDTEDVQLPPRMSVSPPRPPLLEPLDPHQRQHEAEVVIIGGGPSGLTAAILLAQRGVDVLLLERRNFIGHFPRAHLLNVRTMEIFAEMGVADDVYALSPPEDDWHKVVWVTSFDGSTDLHGRKIGEVPAWGGGTDADLYALASPRRFANVSQIRLDRLLWEHAHDACPGRIRGMQEVVSVDAEGADRATVGVVDRVTGERYAVHADYVIGADGGRVIPGLLGIDYEGARSLLDQVSFYMTSDLSKWAHEGVLLTKMINPDGEGSLSANLLALGPDAWGKNSKEWSMGFMQRGRTEMDDAALLERLRKLWGIPEDHAIDLHAVSHWQYEGVVAAMFRRGRAFLVGDSAHRHPPAGGLGLNLGVQDSYNLAWKLAAVLRGAAAEKLLDTYEAERRPVAAHFVAHALENASRNFGIAAALGQQPGQTPEEGWNNIATWLSDTPTGERMREEVAEAVASNALDYSQLNVEAGYSYRYGALIPDGSAPPPGHDSPIVYTPTTRPGHQLPHAWWTVSGRQVSSRELVATTGLTLFVGPQAVDEWEAAAREVGPGLASSLKLVVVGGRGPEEPQGDWAAFSETGPRGAVLVRPDRFVCWRVQEKDDALTQLRQAVETVLGGAGALGDAAPPYMERVLSAADRIKSGRIEAGKMEASPMG